MRCPNCDHTPYYNSGPCPNCRFSGDPDQVEELIHVDWLLDQIETWQKLDPAHRQLIHEVYIARQYELELALKLRLPRFTAEQARLAWPELFQRQTLLQKAKEWLAAGTLHPAAAQAMIDQVEAQIDNLEDQLEGHTRPSDSPNSAEQLDLVNFLLEAVGYLDQNQGFVTPAAHRQAAAPLVADKEKLELALGLRSSAQVAPAPLKEVRPAPAKGAVVAKQPVEAAAVVPPEPNLPPTPFFDRLWRTLLSERTLQALLFLGIFLLFSAALSFVVWGWQDFSAPLRVVIPTGFTVLFFGLGWVVRTRTHLYRSGIALSAIAALLIPIDFYTVYVNFHFLPGDWPLFWLVTSGLCLLAYVFITLVVRSRFFGYLVGTAAGSTVLAFNEVGHQAFGLSLDWRTAGLSILAVVLTVIATALQRGRPAPPTAGEKRPDSRRLAFAEPFRYLALFTAGTLMLLTFAWRYMGRSDYDILHLALTINWWLGAGLFAWAAVTYRSRSLGLLAALSLPIATYLAQADIFNRLGFHPAWHAFGLALLVPLYFLAGFKLLRRGNDPVLTYHGRTAARLGTVLLIFAGLWSLTDLSHGAAAAGSHAVLAGAVILAALLWRRPVFLYGASLLSLSAVTFGMSELNLTLAQLAVGWVSLAITHILAALCLGTRFPAFLVTAEADLPAVSSDTFSRPLVVAGYGIAGLALLPPLYPYEGEWLAYILANWLGLTAWGSRLAHREQPGFGGQGFWRKPIFHWFTALPLPLWLWILFTNRRPPDPSLALALGILAWGLIALSYRFYAVPDTQKYRRPWYLTGLLVSVAAPAAAFAISPAGFVPAMVLLLVGLLYLVDAAVYRQSWELAPAGLVLPWGLLLFLERLHRSFDESSFALAALIASYLIVGLWVERRTYQSRLATRRAVPSDSSPQPIRRAARFDGRFLSPLYFTAHLLLLVLLIRVYGRALGQLAFSQEWTDTMRLWGAAAQLLAGAGYGLFTWGRRQERWGHPAAWLVAAGGGFIVFTFSRGHGSSAAWAALAAITFVLAERGLRHLSLRGRSFLSHRQHAFFRLTWSLYRRPLLLTGWAASATAIFLALVRNLWLLGGGRIQQVWAVIGLSLVVLLYALSARLFRRTRFTWLAAPLLLAPWTIMTHLGWLTPYRFTVPGYGLSWAVLAGLLLGMGLLLSRLRAVRYAFPLKLVAHLLLPFTLLWGIADVATSRFTFALAIGFYGLLAGLDFRRFKLSITEVGSQEKTPRRERMLLGPTRFFYPALGLVPVWVVYGVAWLLPAARHEQYGLLLLVFGPLGLAMGRWLAQRAPQPHLAGVYGRPAYLTGYVAVIMGTMLTAHIPALLVIVLLFDAVLLSASARLFKHPLWVYPAAALVPAALLLALAERGIPGERHGWWLIGLASIYLLLAWALRRINLAPYGHAPLAVAFALVALGLPPSSQDQTGAWWGYGSAAVIYAFTAFWLRQPLLLTPAGALILVPYAIGLRQSGLAPHYYGLALFPSATAALGLGWLLDRYREAWRDFPWRAPVRWPAAIVDRLLGWWALPLYGLGFGLVVASPLFAGSRADLVALNFLLMLPFFGWAVWRFRLPGWLLAAAIAGHLAAGFLLQDLGWWSYAPWAWLRFLPVVVGTALVTLFIERRRGEGSPLDRGKTWKGWSRPLYALVLLDIIIGQLVSFGPTWPGATVSLIHALLIAFFASVWVSSGLLGVGIILGVVALVQAWASWSLPVETLPVLLAQLALAYGLAGYGLAFLRSTLPDDRELKPWLAIWEIPLQRLSVILSLGTLVLTVGLGLDLAGWSVRALLGFPFRQIVELPTVQMVVGVMALLGLLYVAIAFTQRWLRLGYVAIGMLLLAWVLHAFYIQQWDGSARIQWYAIPAGLYLLAVAYLEWQRHNRALARWLDYAAILLLLGSLFWQTLLFGWAYAMVLGVEGFSAFWWGSARRLRRFFYAGMMGMVLATLGQLINSLRSVNQWLVFGGVGLLMVIIAVIVERKLEDIKAWQESLEGWE